MNAPPMEKAIGKYGQCRRCRCPLAATNLATAPTMPMVVAGLVVGVPLASAEVLTSNED